VCLQWTPNVQIKYFMFDWSIYGLFVLNRAWKRDSLKIMIVLYVCPTCSVVKLKIWFETWKARNDVNGVSLFHLSYLITLMAYIRSEWTPNVQIENFLFDCSFYTLFILNRGWKRNSLQIMIFVYVYITWCVVELKTRFETGITRNGVNGVSWFLLSYLITLMAYLCSQWPPNVQIKCFVIDWC
jgi:hypothetical protein